MLTNLNSEYGGMDWMYAIDEEHEEKSKGWHPLGLETPQVYRLTPQMMDGVVGYTNSTCQYLLLMDGRKIRTREWKKGFRYYQSQMGLREKKTLEDLEVINIKSARFGNTTIIQRKEYWLIKNNGLSYTIYKNKVDDGTVIELIRKYYNHKTLDNLNELLNVAELFTG